MTDDPREISELFTFMTSAYLDEPTPENAKRLWRALFELKGWYLIIRGDLAKLTPYIGSADGKSFLAVWTDQNTLNTYIDTANVAPEDEDIRYLFLPLPQVLEYVLRVGEIGVDGIRFNPPYGWAVPFATLRGVAAAFGILTDESAAS